jgi:2-hydroxychromene-2-carboxylate isomerase
MTTRRPPRFYFSLRSPYSWLAYRELLRYHPDVAEALEWRPFWEPDQLSERLLAEAGGEFWYTPMSRPKHLYVLQDVRRLAAARGLSVSWPVDREPCWEIPHLAYLVARGHGRGPDFVAAAYAARWERGENICDRSTIAAIGASLDLEPAELAGAADDPETRAEGVTALLAIHRDGVFGVPFFVTGFDKYWGVDRLAEFVTAVRAQLPDTPPPPEPAMAPGTGRTIDDGHAGGCG